MTDDLDVVGDCLDKPWVSHVRLDEREHAAGLELGVRQVRPRAARQVVDADDLVVVVQQPVDQVGPDEPSRSGHEYAHITTIDDSGPYLPGSTRSMVPTRSIERSNEATRFTPVLSAHATK